MCRVVASREERCCGRPEVGPGGWAVAETNTGRCTGDLVDGVTAGEVVTARPRLIEFGATRYVYTGHASVLWGLTSIFGVVVLGLPGLLLCILVFAPPSLLEPMLTRDEDGRDGAGRTVSDEDPHMGLDSSAYRLCASMCFSPRRCFARSSRQAAMPAGESLPSRVPVAFASAARSWAPTRPAMVRAISAAAAASASASSQ